MLNDKQIAHEEEVFKLAWTTAVLTAGGSATLFVGELTSLRLSFGVLGFVFTLLVLVFTITKDIEIKQATEEERSWTAQNSLA